MVIIIHLLSLSFLSLGSLWILVNFLFYRKDKNVPITKKNNYTDPSWAIIIPAHYESKVIKNILESINNQSIKNSMNDVYVIVESANDPTVAICKKWGANYIVRKKLNQKRKGYALNEGFQEILKQNKHYDLYFIFDADNTLEKHYIEEMLKTYKEGYDIGIGYRNCKNGNDNVIAACSSLTFSMINTLSNQRKTKNHQNNIISGTGFFITGKWIEKWKGYPFHSLTEDYELSLYATLHELTTKYNKDAIFYDEQPCSYKQSATQRMRWIRGYFDSRKQYIPKIKARFSHNNKNNTSKHLIYAGVKPYILMIVGILLELFLQLFLLIQNTIEKRYPWHLSIIVIASCFIFVYSILLIATGVMLIKEKDKLNLSHKSRWKAFFINPLFMMSYLPVAIKALLKKDVPWQPIEHTKNMKTV